MNETVIIILFLLSLILFSGKGSFLIAGYNLSPSKKSDLDEKKLSRAMGGVALFVAVYGLVLNHFFYEVYEYEVYEQGNLSRIVLLVIVIASLIFINRSKRFRK